MTAGGGAKKVGGEDMGGYAGLPREVMGFLAGLEAQNDREWFEAHRADYERLWLGAGLDLAAALAGPAAELGLLSVPKLGGSLRRIHRDLRFSPDKRPYHAHLHLILSAGPGFGKAAGVHLVLGAEGFSYGVGLYAPGPMALAGLRRGFCEAQARAEFLAHLARAEARGVEMGPADLARVPRGWEAEEGWEAGEGWAHLMRRSQVVLRLPAPLPVPEFLFGPTSVAGLLPILADLAPLAGWLQRFSGEMVLVSGGKVL